MTSKAIMTAFVRKGKQVLQGVLKTQTQKVGVKVGNLPKQTQVVQNVVTYNSQATKNKLHRLWQQILPRVYFNSIASELGRRAATRCGRVPLFAFVGLVMSQHTEKEEDEIESKIHEFVKRGDATASPLLQRIQELSLDQFEFGQMIGQGCNAAVYEACLKPEAVTEDDDEDNQDFIDVIQPSITEETKIETSADEPDLDEISDCGSGITVISLSDDELEETERAPQEFHVDSEDDLFDFPDSESEPDSDISVISGPFDEGSDIEVSDEDDVLEDRENKNVSLSMSVSRILAAFREHQLQDAVKSEWQEDSSGSIEENLEYNSLDSSYTAGQRYNLAVKMMFNYGVESNADKIMMEMGRETVPARLAQTHSQMETWQNGHKVRKKKLPPHPNIVEMWGVFVDPVPHLPDCLLNYPAALPARINPHGIGRNMTMFLVMKKYQFTLGDYLRDLNPSFRERLLLLAQLLEAVAHMRRHSVAHRDLKLDNIFLDTTEVGLPQLVVGDFGCCLADQSHGLKIPYTTDNIDRGGNTALMAPEISTAEPGRFSYLDYSKSDLWACGALAYEILGAENPFYTLPSGGRRLDSRTFVLDDLPPLPERTPSVIQSLVYSMLNRNPNQRPTARFAADVMQVYLWAPSDWLEQQKIVTRSEVNWWLISMATEMLLLTTKSTERGLKRCFLETVNNNRLADVLHFLGIQFA